MATLILTSEDLKNSNQKLSLDGIKNVYSDMYDDLTIDLEDIDVILYRECNKDIILKSQLTNLKKVK